MKRLMKQLCLWTLILAMVLSIPASAFAQVKVNHEDIAGDKAKFVNSLTPVQIAKPDGKAKDFVKEPDLPAIYTLRTDFKAEKGEKYSVNYQPYVASVGAYATPEEKAKVNKEIKLPDMAGYKKPAGEESFTNSYDAIVNAATYGHKTEDNGDKYLALNEYKYTAIQNNIKVKHVFQNMEDFNKFTNKDGTITKNDGTVIDKEGHETKYDLKEPAQKEKYEEFVRDHETIRTLSGNTGSTLEVQALQENERPGFEPQVERLKTQVPEDTSDFKIEYRYNRAAYDVVFDTQDGTPLPSRTYYYEQEIPKIDENSIPTKIGCEFQGWKPSHDLEGADGTKYKKGEIIKDASGNAIVDLGNIYYQKDGSGKLQVQDGDPVKGTSQNEIKLKMPALKLGDGKSIPREKLTFTAVWKDKEKADYAIQFWAEKADHPDNASRLEKYDYVGTRVHTQEATGTRPDLAKEPVKGVPFPDLDQARLDRIWAGEKFYADKYLYLNKFFVYNKDLTDEQNKDPKNPTVVKGVSATGKTVYNIYFDRQVYDLYFTKSNVLSAENTFYPEIYVPDGEGGAKKAGGPGNPYHFTARFNQLMLGWPNDAMQTKGFDEGKQSYGWGPNYGVPNWPLHLDTPPYRLNADEFLDMPKYDDWGGYVSQIDKGNGTTIDVNKDPRYKDAPYKALSFGIKQDKGSMPHHMDFWMDGFKPEETIIRYDLYRFKADTNSLTYGHKYSKVQGFTPYGTTIEEGSEENGRITEDDIDTLNDERGEITPYPDKDYTDTFGFNNAVGQMHFRAAFFNNADEFGDPLDGNRFETNGYIRFKYHRNKYPLRFNTDPTKIKDDSAFNEKNSLATFYEFPLKALSPDVDENNEYKKVGTKVGPKNLLDDPDNLFKLGLKDLLQKDKKDPNKFFKDKDGHYRVKRPEGLSDQLIFKGWATDPAGKKMVWQNKDEKMPSHAVNLYAIWDEPDYKWKVTVDPNGGELSTIDPKNLTTEMKTIKEGDIGREEENTYPVKGYESEKAKEGTQVFTVVQRQQLKKLPKPTRYGYDFLGWEVIRYQKDKDGNYTNEQDTSYREKYKVPELYSFGTDVVSPIYLKAIWVENKRANVKVLHYYLKNNSDGKLVLDTSKYPNPDPNDLDFKRVGDYVPATGEKQDEHWILASNAELMEKLSGKWFEKAKDSNGEVKEIPHELKPEYEKYNERVKLNNTYFQSFRVQDNINVGTEQNPVYKPNPENIFRFYYRPFRTRNYKVNYIDERGKKAVEDFFKGLDLTDTKGLTGDELLEANNANKAKFKANKDKLEKILDDYKVINKEKVTSECRHYDARNYRKIPGWTLVGKPQQQLFYDVNEDTNEFLGINGTGSNEIYFYYKDARVIEVKNPKDPVPDGYVRVTFKIDDKHKGGVFEDKDGNKVTELHYDVIKGLKSDNLPHPIIWEDGKTDSEGKPIEKEANRYYITPDQGKSFKEWDNEKWLNKETLINRDYTFTAYFDWSGLTSSGLVRTEAFKDPKNTWTNDFAPKLEDLKKQLVWKEKDEEKTIPEGTDIKLVYKDDAGTETPLNTDDDVFNLVKEMGKADKDQTVRVLNIVAKVKFKDGKAVQELPIPITVYKNVYEALNKEGDKPIYLTDAEGKEAKDGGLKDILKDNTDNRYIKVTVKPNKDFDNKDNKVYYVNPNAWVEIPKVESTGDSRFTNWTADIADYNEESKANGVFDFGKRHKFTKDTIITPVGAKDVVEQEKDKDKPDVPKTYVKVIVKTTDKATDETKFEKTFWVNPKADVTINVTNPKGKKVEADATKPGTVGYQMDFAKWQSEEDTPRTWGDKIVGKFEKDTTIVAKYSVEFEKIKDLTPKTDTVPTPQGKTPTVDQIKEKITPPEGKTIKEVKIVKDPDVNTPGDSKVQVIVEYTDGSSVGTNDNPIEVPVKVHEPIVKGNPDGSKPKDALANYVKVTFTAGTGGTVSGDLVYYVSPEVEVDMTASAGKITKTPDVGYYVNGEKWTNKDNKTLKGTFKDAETEFVFKFEKSEDIVEKTNDPSQKIPEGYVTVTFKTDGHGKVGGVDEKIYYVNPKAGITLKVLGEGETATDKQLAVPTYAANENYTFVAWQEAIDEKTPITSDRIHVATFQYGKVTLTYDKGGEDVTGNVPDAVKVNFGETVGLADKGTLKKPNHEFVGWKLDKDETLYKPGAQVKLEKARTATAQWKPVTHKVSFNTMRGSLVPTQTVEHGKTATKPVAPTLEGKVFMGWKEKETDTSYFDFNTPIEADKSLIAIWQDAVQKINDGDNVEDQFIKVTFKQGKHGLLVPDKDKKDEKVQTVIYKVAKADSFEDAVKHGLVVPGIAPAKYYKVAEDKPGELAKHGWDKELKLEGKETTFTAQYELEANVIPVNPNKTNEELKKDMPEGMVLVDFQVDSTKAYMLGDSKFYVKKSEVVNIKPPLVVKTDESYNFRGWSKTLDQGLVKETFDVDTTIGSGEVSAPDIRVKAPSAGAGFVEISNLTEGATGHLVLTRGGNEYEFTSGPITIKTRVRRKIVEKHIIGFDLSTQNIKLQSKDVISVFATNGNLKSDAREYTIR